MEKGIVIQLQEDAIGGDVDIEELLRKAYLVAHKLDIKDFKEWIRNEQNGYQNKEIPDYRTVGGKIKAYNPVYGWIPVIFGSNFPKFVETLKINSPIASILDSCKESRSANSSVDFVLPSEYIDLLNTHTTGLETDYIFRTSTSEMKKIINAVRNNILNYALLLEDNGIKGDGLSFSDEERKSAQNIPVINNYTNNFYSDTRTTRIIQGNIVENKNTEEM